MWGLESRLEADRGSADSRYDGFYAVRERAQHLYTGAPHESSLRDSMGLSENRLVSKPDFREPASAVAPHDKNSNFGFSGCTDKQQFWPRSNLKRFEKKPATWDHPDRASTKS